MALRDTINRMRDGVSQMARRFLHGENEGYAPQGYGQPEYYEPGQAGYGQESAPYDNAYQQQYQQPGQPPYQQPYQQQAQPQYQAYQQEAYPPQETFQSPYAGSYGRQTQPQQPQQQRQSRPQGAEKVVPFPGVMSDGAGNTFSHELQILQLRDRNECRAIIEHLRNRCTVALNMDNIASDTEKQRCVDMLSGAAYTLNCSISRISTRGVYVITPESVRVMQDDATKRLNGVARQAAQRPGRAHSYAARGAQAPADAYEPQDGGYQGQAEYGFQEGPAPQGYQNPYEGDGEYRTAGYYAQEPRYASGYGR